MTEREARGPLYPGRPRGVALLICDGVLDHGNGKRDLLGLFDEINASSFPATVAKFVVLIGIEGTGTHQCELAISDRDGRLVATGGFEVRVPESTRTFEVAVPFHDTLFEHPGDYVLRVWNDGRVLLERSIVLRLK